MQCIVEDGKETATAYHVQPPVPIDGRCSAQPTREIRCLSPACQLNVFPRRRCTQDYEAKLDTTKAAAAAANERAVRAKAAADKEKRSYQTKLDRYMTQNEELHAEHQAALGEMRRQQDEELADARLHTAKASQHAVDGLEQELRECIVEAETRETHLRAKHASEVEALSVTHRQQLQRAHSDAAEWQLKLEEGTGLCEQLREQLQLQGEAEAEAKWQLEESERRAERLETELRQLGRRVSADRPHASCACACSLALLDLLPRARLPAPREDTSHSHSQT